ncbi:transposase [Streptomyces fagopyri]|uniref:transposase n=1 Tax=Streptomyces fagopyri TaxID=2662397 RepID=UPI00389A2160
MVLAGDVSPWLRPDTGTVPDRSLRHTYGRDSATHHPAGPSRSSPPWGPAVPPGPPSWTRSGSPRRAAITAEVRKVVERLIAAGRWVQNDPAILIVLDAGYDAGIRREERRAADSPSRPWNDQQHLDNAT